MPSVLGAVDWEQGVEDAWRDIAAFVPDLIGFLAILIIGYIITKVLSKAVEKILERVGFDRAVERGGVAKAMSRTKYDPSDLVGKIVFYTLFLFVLVAAFGVFGPNPVSDLLSAVVGYLPNVIVAIIIIVVLAAIAAAVREVVQATLGGLSYGKALANAAGAAILAIGAFAALNQLKIAEEIVNGLFYAVLAAVVGVTVVAVGGGGIRPMQTRWENTLTKVEEEAPRAKQQTGGAEDRIAARASELKEKA